MKKIVETDKAPKAVGPYSQAIDINGTLFISGQIALDPVTGKITGENIKEQTLQVLKNLSSILTAAGYSKNDVVKCTCYLDNINDFHPMNEVYSQFFNEELPARAAFEVSKLPMGVLVEIEGIAMK